MAQCEAHKRYNAKVFQQQRTAAYNAREWKQPENCACHFCWQRQAMCVLDLDNEDQYFACRNCVQLCEPFFINSCNCCVRYQCMLSQLNVRNQKKTAIDGAGGGRIPINRLDIKTWVHRRTKRRIHRFLINERFFCFRCRGALRELIKAINFDEYKETYNDDKKKKHH